MDRSELLRTPDVPRHEGEAALEVQLTAAMISRGGSRTQPIDQIDRIL